MISVTSWFKAEPMAKLLRIVYTICVAGLLVFLVNRVYVTAYTAGYNKKTNETLSDVLEYKKAIDYQGSQIYQLSKTLSDSSDAKLQLDKTRHSEILKAAAFSSKPMYTISTVTGKCEPSEEFAKAYIGLLR